MADKLYVDIDKAVGLGYLSDWYQSSIDDTFAPIWTDEHLMELLNDFLVIPNDTPTADVKEVKRGRWIGEALECSVCKRNISEIYDADSYMSSGIEDELTFCPFCGADMRGDTDDL